MRSKPVKSIHRSEYQLLLEMLIELRQQKDVTQTELAERIGKEQTYVSKVERGIRRVDVIELRAILLALGANLPQFVRRFEKSISGG
jgi:transcriptional regulator with XRE-family HTH domain